jgi:hypothetical protein
MKIVPEDMKVLVIQKTHCDARKAKDMKKAVEKRWLIC